MIRRMTGDARLVVWVCASVLAVILVAAFLAPAREDNNPVPSTWNSGSLGAKAAYELLGQLGYKTARWNKPAADLREVDAAHTTLVLAEAWMKVADLRKEKAGVAEFLKRGGRVVATGAITAMMLPEANVGPPDHIYTKLCYTTPQSLSGLGRAGRIAMPVPTRWTSSDARVDQACGEDSVVVHYGVTSGAGAAELPGEVVWWASAAPLTNRGLKQDADLRLLLASVGGLGRTVLFDEYIHGARESLWATVSGTPVKILCWQLVAVALLLLLSFGRRSGPVRAMMRTSRASPLEFAESMGALYEKAGAAEVAVGAAERRLMDFLRKEGGLPNETLRNGPEAIAAAVASRFGYAGRELVDDLKTAQDAEFAHLSAKSALEMVRRLDGHIANLWEKMKLTTKNTESNEKS